VRKEERRGLQKSDWLFKFSSAMIRKTRNISEPTKNDECDKASPISGNTSVAKKDKIDLHGQNVLFAAH
jgi:hypothetical protein